MKKTLLSILIGSVVFAACKKESLVPIASITCSMQTANPGNSSYPSDSLVSVNYSGKNCGLLPLNKNNYWIYQDSIFNNGVFQEVQFDTLQFEKTYLTLSDDLIWWKSNINVGLPDILYSSDSSIFGIEERMFLQEVTWDASKEYSLFSGETANYLAHFDDNAAQGKSIKLESPMNTPAGVFNDCIQFEKNARSYRKDEVYFKPGIGVIKYSEEKAPLGSPVVKLQQVSTLISFHIE